MRLHQTIRLCLALPLLLAAAPAFAQLLPPPVPQAPPAPLHILLPPPVQWTHDMLNYTPALRQTGSDLANLTNGVKFGMTPEELNATLPDPLPRQQLADLPLANEYPDEVHYFGVPIAAAGGLRMNVAACMGNGSYVVFLFSSKGLFRISYRLVSDKSCPDTSRAARAVLAAYVPLGLSVALSSRYRTVSTEVVDITDPGASFLIPVRWHQGAD